MKSAIGLVLGLFFAVPAFAVDCVSNQGAVPNASIGISGTFGPQGGCLPGSPGSPGNLIGFAFRLTACQSAFIEEVAIQFQIAQVGDQYHHYLWRDVGGLPNDACGMECGVAVGNPVAITANGPTIQRFPWDHQGCPCEVQSGERFYVGVIYANVTSPADWQIARNNIPIGAGNGFWNTTGNHGAWVELSTVGFGNRFAVEALIGPDCGLVPADEATWGTIKNLYR
jgi:hypothetical protein